MRKSFARCALALLLALGAAHFAVASNAAPAYVQQAVPKAVPRNIASLRWFGLHIYDARLYASAGFNAENFKAEPFALELIYARNLEGKEIAERSRDEIAGLGLGSEDQRAAWLKTMVKLFPNVKSGTRLIGINLPNVGVAFYLDGKPLGRVEDPAFAQAFFSIWLDPKTSQPELRTNLLKSAAA